MSAQPSRERIDRAIARLDDEIGGIVDAVLHDERFKALEAAWRGLEFVVSRVDFQENVELAVWSYSKAELAADFEDRSDVTETRFFRSVYTAEYGQHGGRPYGLVFANWAASAAAPELDLLARVASVAAMAHAPVMLSAAPDLLRVQSFAELQSMRDPDALRDEPGLARWMRFRATEDSRYVGVLLPRILLRLPYRDATGGASRFVYDEGVTGSASYLWGSPIFAFAARVADSFARYRSYAAIVGSYDDPPPVLEAHAALGAGHVKPPVDVVLSQRLEKSLSEMGFIPMGWDSVRRALRFATANSVQAPRTFGSSEGGQAATLSHLLGTRLPYLLLACRFAHYLKVLEREKVGGHRESGDIEADLNAWLSDYVITMDGAAPGVRMKYPLRSARVKVSPVDGSAGVHRIEVLLQPHLRYMRQAFTLSVSGRVEA